MLNTNNSQTLPLFNEVQGLASVHDKYKNFKEVFSHNCYKSQDILDYVQNASVEYCTTSKARRLSLINFCSCLKAAVADLLCIIS